MSRAGPPIQWKVFFKSPVARVYAALATNAGRRGFWALEADERNGEIHFRFPNGVRETSRIIAATANETFALAYFNTPTQFVLTPVSGGVVLTLTVESPSAEEWSDLHAGWVSVLMAMKAYVDFGVDLRNGQHGRTWDQGFIDQ